MKEKKDIYQDITNKIIERLETAGDSWLKPWKNDGSVGSLPQSVSTGKSYRGANLMYLWAIAQEKQYTSNQWGTFKAWVDKGACVKKGEKATFIVFWSTFNKIGESEDNDNTEVVGKKVFWSKPYPVFNADQVEGYTQPERIEISLDARVNDIDNFIEQTGADIRHGGSSAYYMSPNPRDGDYIQMPNFHAFKDAESYYSTLFHEVTHWTGSQNRLKRGFGNRFGSESYAFEELIAELGASFLCADLGISQAPRDDHAKYIKGWLKVLKSDKKAIFTAASAAQKAMDYLHELTQKQSVSIAA